MSPRHFNPRDLLSAARKGRLGSAHGFAGKAGRQAGLHRERGHAVRVRGLTAGSLFKMEGEERAGSRVGEIVDEKTLARRGAVPAWASEQRWVRGVHVRYVIFPVAGLPAVVLEEQGNRYTRVL